MDLKIKMQARVLEGKEAIHPDPFHLKGEVLLSIWMTVKEGEIFKQQEIYTQNIFNDFVKEWTR